MRFVVVGLSHHTAPIEIRERFAELAQPIEGCLAAVRKLGTVEEVCILSTCNRVEFCAFGASSSDAVERSLVQFIQQQVGLSSEETARFIFAHAGNDALRHLFRVSCSLDSMVLGEPQILGQVKEAYKTAVSEKTVGPNLQRIFERSFQVAKRVRTETGISENAVSMSFAAVELGRQIFDELEGKEVLVLGAGKMGTLAAKHLRAHGARTIRVASRTFSTAQTLAQEIGGEAFELEKLQELLCQSDIVISSTASRDFVVKKKMMGKVMRERRYEPILFVDIAVPRDVDPKVTSIDNVFVYDVDDLRSVLDENRENRAKEAETASRMVEVEVDRYVRWSRSQTVVPVIKALRKFAEEIAEAEAARTLQSCGLTEDKTAKRVRSMSQSIVNKMLHPMLSKLKEQGAEGDPLPLVDMLTEMFGLPSEALGEAAPAPEGDEAAPENVLSIVRENSG